MPEERLRSLMAACDVLVNLRSPTMGETSGSVIRGALARQADARLRRRLVLGAARRRRAEDPGRRVRGGDDRGGARARGRPRRRARRGGARRTSAASTTSGSVADAYVAALEEAAGGDAVDRRDPARGSPRPPPRSASTTRPSSSARVARRGEADGAMTGDAWRDSRAGPCAPCRRARRPARLAIPAWVVARRGSSSSRSSSAIALGAPDGRAVDHGRRDRLLRAREERSRRTASSSSAASRAHGYGFVYPVLIAPAWRLFASIPRRLRGGEGDQRRR